MSAGPRVVDVGLRDELLRRRDVDQQARRALVALFARDRDEVTRTADDQEVLDRVDQVDRENTEWLADLVTRRGWPIRSLVGEEAASAAWLLAQHADRNVALQLRFLELMRAAPESEVLPRNIAYLTDRVLLADARSRCTGPS